MNSTPLSSSVQQALCSTLNGYPLVAIIVQRIHDCGGRALLVGGAVRDLLLGIPVKDLDIEVHGLSLHKLEEILNTIGPVSLVGKSFGVLRLHGLDVDWSLPRTDSSGRKPKVKVDPLMSVEDAFRRRDLTINAMGIDLITFQLLDPFNGMHDLKNNILRAPDVRLFIEDPLRFFRVMQFIGRFEMKPDEELNQVCRRMDIHAVSRERIEVEFAKLFLKSARPSLGIRWLHDIERLHEVLPEVAVLVGVQQEPSWHPEGDVFEHTMQALDASARLTSYNDEKKLILMYAALCHDLGKAVTTTSINGVWRSHGHDVKGVPLAKLLLKRITHHIDLIEAVSVLVRYHMCPFLFVKEGAKPPAYRRLANNLAPHANMQMLADLACADKSGRNHKSHDPLHVFFPELDEFLDRAQRAGVRYTKLEAVLQGRDLMDVVCPGPAMGRLLKIAYDLQVEEGITDKNELKQRALAKFKK